MNHIQTKFIMEYSQRIKAISEVKAQAAEIIRALHEDNAPPLIVTQNGEARAVLMSVREYEEIRESLALLKALSLSDRSFAKGRARSARRAFATLASVWDNHESVAGGKAKGSAHYPAGDEA